MKLFYNDLCRYPIHILLVEYIHGLARSTSMSDGQRKVLKRFVHAFGPSQPTIFVSSIVDGPLAILIDNVQIANGPIVDDVSSNIDDSCLIQRKS